MRRPFVVDRGRGDPVLLVHGQPGLGSDWDKVAAQLTDHRLLIVDRPGFGRSGEKTRSIEGNAEVLGDLTHLPHGRLIGLMLPHVLEWSAIGCPEKLARIAQALGENVDGLSPRAGASRATDSPKSWPSWWAGS